MPLVVFVRPIPILRIPRLEVKDSVGGIVAVAGVQANLTRTGSIINIGSRSGVVVSPQPRPISPAERPCVARHGHRGLFRAPNGIPSVKPPSERVNLPLAARVSAANMTPETPVAGSGAG